MSKKSNLVRHQLKNGCCYLVTKVPYEHQQLFSVQDVIYVDALRFYLHNFTQNKMVKFNFKQRCRIKFKPCDSSLLIKD